MICFTAFGIAFLAVGKDRTYDYKTKIRENKNLKTENTSLIKNSKENNIDIDEKSKNQTEKKYEYKIFTEIR